jgi:hypothetical protein
MTFGRAIVWWHAEGIAEPGRRRWQLRDRASRSSPSRGPNHIGNLFSCLDWESPCGDRTQRFPLQSLPRLLQNVIEPLRQSLGLLRHFRSLEVVAAEVSCLLNLRFPRPSARRRRGRSVGDCAWRCRRTGSAGNADRWVRSRCWPSPSRRLFQRRYARTQ